MKSIMSVTGSILAFGCFLIATPSRAVIPNYDVPATANISSAGLSTPVAPGGSGAGILPVLIPVSAGQNAFQFSASGSITENDVFGIFHGPDGRPDVALLVNTYAGISGFYTDQTLPLTGVFLTDSAAQNPAPLMLDFSDQGLGKNFATLSPLIGQVFFIGDGQTSGGMTQTFYAPAGATRLFLGFPDAPFGNGDPGAFDDNSGSLSVAVTAVPEPASSLIGASALALLTAFRLRKGVAQHGSFRE